MKQYETENQINYKNKAEQITDMWRLNMLINIGSMNK